MHISGAEARPAFRVRSNRCTTAHGPAKNASRRALLPHTIEPFTCGDQKNRRQVARRATARLRRAESLSRPTHLGQADWVEFELGGFLTGSIVGQGRGGTGSGYASTSLSRSICDAPSGSLVGNVYASTGVHGGSVRSFNESQQIDINTPLSTGFFSVPRGASIGFTIAMSVTALSDNSPFGDHGTVTSDFSNTFRLNAGQVFNILTPGMTVNSRSAGIVNNALPAPVPVPGALVFFLPAAMPLCALGGRRTRSVLQTRGRNNA